LGLLVACARATEAAVGFSREEGGVPAADLRPPPDEDVLRMQHR
jgi:hypothetical protein